MNEYIPDWFCPMDMGYEPEEETVEGDNFNFD